jgi:hypothetical protein
MAEPARPRSKKGPLIALFMLLFVAAAGAAVLTVPLVDCGLCEGSGKLSVALRNSKREVQGTGSEACPGCQAGKVTVYRSLKLPPIETLLPPAPQPAR